MSTHTARWIGQITDQGWDVHLFPVNHMAVHPSLRNITVHQPWKVVRPRRFLLDLVRRPWRALCGGSAVAADSAQESVRVEAIYPIPVIERLVPRLSGRRRVRLGESDATAPAEYGPAVLARLVRKIKPDLIHSLEFQHCGYNVLRAKELVGETFPPWLVTNWGSDIYYYRGFPEHRAQISRLLRSANYYSCECERDVTLAKELGFAGRVMPIMPNTGGLDLGEIGRLRSGRPPSVRKIVMVKGYQHFAGRALTALEAVERCADDLKHYKIVVFSASPEILGRVDELRAWLGLDILVLPHTNHDYILRMFSRARVYLGVSISDAISTSMLEAMAMGTFPIQTSTSCCDEWIQDGVGGFIIPPDDVTIIAERLERALSQDELVDKAAERNWATVCDRLDSGTLKQRAIALYEGIFQGLESEGRRNGA